MSNGLFQRSKHPFAKFFWTYQTIGVVISLVIVIFPPLYNQWLLWFFIFPYLTLIPWMEICLLMREKRLGTILRRFGWFWLVILCGPALFHLMVIQNGWALRVPIGCVYLFVLIMPFDSLWFVRMHRRGLL